jgi:cell division protein FtsB
VKIVASFGLCLLLFTIFTGDNGLPALLRVRRDMRTLSQQIAALRAENTQLKARAEALRTDPSAIEAVARETLGLARPDELVVYRESR